MCGGMKIIGFGLTCGGNLNLCASHRYKAGHNISGLPGDFRGRVTNP